jgi:hypothetical protein
MTHLCIMQSLMQGIKEMSEHFPAGSASEHQARLGNSGGRAPLSDAAIPTAPWAGNVRDVLAMLTLTGPIHVTSLAALMDRPLPGLTRDLRRMAREGAIVLTRDSVLRLKAAPKRAHRARWATSAVCMAAGAFLALVSMSGSSMAAIPVLLIAIFLGLTGVYLRP